MTTKPQPHWRRRSAAWTLRADEQLESQIFPVLVIELAEVFDY